mgnify:CR=1 FL=1
MKAILKLYLKDKRKVVINNINPDQGGYCEGAFHVLSADGNREYWIPWAQICWLEIERQQVAA